MKTFTWAHFFSGTLLLLLTAYFVFTWIKGRQLRRDSKELLWLLKTDLSDYYKNGEIIGMPPPRAERILYKMRDLMQSQYSLQLIEKQIEYSALQSQINPHFLYNTLEAIRSQALFNKQAEIAAMTEKLGRFFRYCISNREDIVTIQDELDNIRDYFFIQQYRFENRFSFDVLCSAPLDKAIPKMTLQPIVENAIFHGLEQKRGRGAVTIQVIQTQCKFYITISDNGIGMSEEQVIRMNQKLQRLEKQNKAAEAYRKGIALTNVNNRIKLQFGEEYGLRVCSVEGQGTDVEVCIPVMELREVHRQA
ncbi:MAG: sensor histidine kinase [Lachnospiraceae bacterium]|jgi:two-component system sensor histidine kinase YesM|nr:sensor histidine kinase [Lachnospiraceae bacterium]